MPRIFRRRKSRFPFGNKFIFYDFFPLFRFCNKSKCSIDAFKGMPKCTQRSDRANELGRLRVWLPGPVKRIIEFKKWLRF